MNATPRSEFVGRLTSSEEALAEHLATRIFDGDWLPGAPLREQQLADDYQVGRYTVRAALRRLVNDGLLAHHPNRGTTVMEFSSTDIEEIYSLRELFEEGVARLLANRGIWPAAAERELRDFESLPADVSWHRVVEVDVAFHTALVAATDNQRLDRAYRSITTEMRFCVMQLRPFYPSPTSLAEEHKELLEAIASGDEDVAATAVREHLAQAIEHITSGGLNRPLDDTGSLS